MSNKEEKKIFVPELFPKSQDLTKRWFVFYYAPTPEGGKKRVKEYGKLNRLKTIEERLNHAKELFQQIKALAPFSEEISEQNEIEQVKLKTKPLLTSILEEFKPAYRPKTYSTYESKIKHFHIWLNGKNDAHITKQEANKFLLDLLKQGKSKGTAYNYARCLCAVYQKWTDKDPKNNINPFSGVIHIKKNPEGCLPFSDIQIKKLKPVLETKYPQVWLATQILYFCFIRPKEMRGLKIANIDFELGTIQIPGTISKNGKTEKVLIPTPLMNILAELQSLPVHYFILGKDHTPGPSPIGVNRLNYLHSKALTECNICGNYSFYSWKHTGAVKAVKAGINIVDLKNQLRHHSLDMVYEYLKSLGVLDSIELRNVFPSLE